jgi:glutathione peroxidase
MRKLFFITIALAAIFMLYVSMVNPGMTVRQKIMKALYPAVTALSRMAGTNADKVLNTGGVKPPQSVYDIPLTMIDGSQQTLAQFRGKKILVVNTASDCGYTGQYEGLQALHAQYREKVAVIGFPANDFKEQEKGSNEEIGAFCKRNYGVEFPLSSKVTVVKGSGQHPLFSWLSSKEKNGWNGKAPSWNFSKYLISGDGALMGYFGPAVEPLSEDITKLLEP